MTRPPWEYFFEEFSSQKFPDMFYATVLAAGSLLIILIVLYITRTRALHRHAPYLEMWEWIWWTGLITFSMILVACLFKFEFILVLTIEIAGIATLVWIRFRRFPPFLAAYEKQLAKQKYASVRKFSDPDATIRKRGGRRQRRRR